MVTKYGNIGYWAFSLECNIKYFFSKYVSFREGSPKKIIKSPTKVKAKVDTGLKPKSESFSISLEERRFICRETMSQLKMIEKLNKGMKKSPPKSPTKSPTKCISCNNNQVSLNVC